VQGTSPDNRQYFGSSSSSVGVKKDANKTSDLSRPVDVFVILDEQADSINDAAFMHDPGYTQGQERWRDLPASYHNRAGSFSFADGHSEIHKWLDPRTVQAVRYFDDGGNSANAYWSGNLSYSKDYEWMDDHMPYK
jgi:prepilin-type processing-associated H-X9-DG protein